MLLLFTSHPSFLLLIPGFQTWCHPGTTGVEILVLLCIITGHGDVQGTGAQAPKKGLLTSGVLAGEMEKSTGKWVIGSLEMVELRSLDSMDEFPHLGNRGYNMLEPPMMKVANVGFPIRDSWVVTRQIGKKNVGIRQGEWFRGQMFFSAGPSCSNCRWV